MRLLKSTGLAVAVFLMFGGDARSQSIFTVAGGGNNDGRAAASTELSLPIGVAVDGAGHIYVAENATHRVRKIDAATGIVSTVAGTGAASYSGDGGPATEASINSPQDIVVDRSGNLYIADGDNDVIRKVVLSTGIITTFAGTGREGVGGDGGPATQALLSGPRALALDSAGNVYVAANHRIRKITVATGIITTVAGIGSGFGQGFGFSGDGGPATEARLSNPFGVAVDPAGNIYIADSSNFRIRKVDGATGIITTIAGTGERGFSGDGGPATSAQLFSPSDVAVDGAGNLVFADLHRLRRIELATGVITTIAGGEAGFAGDGGPAAAAQFRFPRGLAFDEQGNLFFADADNNRVRRIEKSTGIINTIAGIGTRPLGDGGLATGASLRFPRGLAVDSMGNFYFADFLDGTRVRRVDVRTGIIDTVAGTSQRGFAGDGGPALSAQLNNVWDVAVDGDGNLYISDSSRIRKVTGATGIINTIAGDGTGGFAGDGGPATAARFGATRGISVDAAGNLFIADQTNQRIRRIDAASGIITTVAGNGTAGFSGDGGPATAASLNNPFDVALTPAGDFIIADRDNRRLRKVDAASQTITTIAGNGATGEQFGKSTGDGGPATLAGISDVENVTVDPSGNIFFSSFVFDSRVRKIDTAGIITTFAGSGQFGFSGDLGPATSARLAGAAALAANVRGDIYINDSGNNRIRVVYACVNVGAPALTSPGDSASNVSTAATLTWNAVDGAFRYDVFLSTEPAANTLVAEDVSSPTVTLSNLQPATRYFWRVVAKGDEFCPNPSTASSAVRSFVTAASCDRPGSFTLNGPAEGATTPTTTALSWTAAAGAGPYDIFLGTTTPPSFLASTPSTSFEATGLTPGTTYYWSVVARAACDNTKVTRAAVRSFRTGGTCPAPGAFQQIAPANGAMNVAASIVLEWSPSPNATAYDLLLGTSSNPPVYLLDVTTTRVRVSGLDPGQTYSWRVVAKVGCNTATASTGTGTFTISGDCTAPQATSFVFAPPGTVSAGQTYVMSWADAQNLNADGFYVVERSIREDFASLVDTQQTAGTAASFTANEAGTYHHRVRAMNPCGASATNSPSRAVVATAAPANVIFTVQPQPVVTALGERLEGRPGRFVIENLGSDRATVIISVQEIDSVPFFRVVDPELGDVSVVTLEPRQPRQYEIAFSGPPNDQPASYQGIIFLTAVGATLDVTPFAFVNLRVGGGESATPEFRRNGVPVEYLAFPPFAGDDTARAPVTVEVRNPGTSPMELAQQIGPEVWLEPESGWNSTPIPAGASRSVRLFTRRNRAPHASALPRYTYFTVVTRSGESARLLVQDNDATSTSAGRASALDPSTRTVVIPEVVSSDGAGGVRTFSTVRLTNLGSETLQVELFFTPAGADGFDATRVRQATIVIPPNDVANLTDPLQQLWALPRPAKGQLEVRTAPERAGLLTVRSTVVTSASGGGVFTYTVPTLSRGQGARAGYDHSLAGISSSADTRPVLSIVETSGADRVSVRVDLLDSDGNVRGQRTIDLLRYSYIEVDDFVAAFGAGTSIDAARIELTVLSGGGSAAAIVKLLNRTTGEGATLVSRGLDETSSIAGFLTATNSKTRDRYLLRASSGTDSATRTFLLPTVVNGRINSRFDATFRTVLGLVARVQPATFRITYREGENARTATVSVAARRVVEYRNVLEQLFGVAEGALSEGSILIEADGPSDVYATLIANSRGASLVSVKQSLPVIGSDSEFVSSSASQRPLYVDGLEQSTDPSRGTTWSLAISEIGGSATKVTARVYEAGNRTTPIAQKEFSLAPLQQLKFGNLFAAMDLDNALRKKDRTNMMLSLVATSGQGAMAAIVQALDNRTGDSKSVTLSPAKVSPAGLQATIIAPSTTGTKPQRRRAVQP